MKKTLWVVAVALGMVVVSAVAQEKPAVEFTGSGFLTLGVGKMLGGTRGNVGDYKGPSFISDYAQAGVYDGRSGLQWKPDSKLGVQGVVSMDNGRFSVTGQAVARGARDGKINLEWLYGSYKVNDEVTLQVGRKRLPMFYYSDTQDIGVALPWTHLPPQLYGWEAVNYNGINVMARKQLGGWSVTGNMMYGSESIKDAGYDKIYNGRQSRTDAKWKNIFGGDLSLQKDWFEARFVYMQSKTSSQNISGRWDAAQNAYDPTTADAEPVKAKQRIYGVAFNIDYNDWMARTEFIHIVRPGLDFKDNAYIIAAGKRFGKWQLFLSQSRYWSTPVLSQGADPTAQEAHQTRSITLRYDLTTSSALKAQLDFQRDRSGPNWGIALDSSSATGSGPPYGNARLFTITYDMVF